MTSKKLHPGSEIPDFWLPDINGVILPKDKLIGASAILITFICNHCNYVKHIRSKLVEIIKEYQQFGVAAIAINSNDIEKVPDDSPDRMKQDALQYGYTFPYLFDGTQEVARLFKVSCTPDFFVFNKEGKLFYHGQMDDSRPENDYPVTGKDLTFALDSVLKNKPPVSNQKPGNGSCIVWRNTKTDYFTNILTHISQTDKSNVI
ncbi:MAG TPA: thioredoxin family protein [Chitinispirillaceae bacterium]|nr:thioredoxin family protein [Chitinispirillaceae bacterium]